MQLKVFVSLIVMMTIADHLYNLWVLLYNVHPLVRLLVSPQGPTLYHWATQNHQGLICRMNVSVEFIRLSNPLRHNVAF